MEKRETADGSPTFFSDRYRECYHSLSGAVQEARERYAAPCGIAELAEGGSLAVLDVGFGLGYNLAAAVEAAGGIYSKCRLTTVSLEMDEGVLEFVRTFSGPEEFSSIYPALKLLVQLGRYTSGGLDMGLRRGPAERTINELPDSPVFDAVFLDPFTPAVNPELWTVEFLERIKSRMKPRAILSTYSSAMKVKENLLKAGFGIGLGPKVGDKGSGTLASLEADLPPLDERDMAKLKRRIERED